MDVHAEYILKCKQAAKWLNTPYPITEIPKEFIDGAHATTSTILGLCTPISQQSCQKQKQIQLSSSLSSSKCIKPNKRKRSSSLIKSISSSCCQQNSCKSKQLSTPIHCTKSHIEKWDDEQPLLRLRRNFPSLQSIATGKPQQDRSLLYVPVQLVDHFIFGVIFGCPIPPPYGVSTQSWIPLVTRFVLDISRKCCLMFSYFEDGSIVVICDSFDELGDHQVDATFFETTPLVGVFPRGLRGRMRIFEQRDCPKCTIACISCLCEKKTRIASIVNLRKSKNYHPPPGISPSFIESSTNENETSIKTSPYWAQILDEYIWSRIGSYCVRVDYNPESKSTNIIPSSTKTNQNISTPFSVVYRSSVSTDTRPSVETMIQKVLFEKAVSALEPGTKDTDWESKSSIMVNQKNCVNYDKPSSKDFFFDLYNMPGFQQDYLLKAPSNVVSNARIRAELARTEAERVARRRQLSTPIVSDWVSDHDDVVQQILSNNTETLNFQPTSEMGQADINNIEFNQFDFSTNNSSTEMATNKKNDKEKSLNRSQVEEPACIRNNINTQQDENRNGNRNELRNRYTCFSDALTGAITDSNVRNV